MCARANNMFIDGSKQLFSFIFGRRCVLMSESLDAWMSKRLEVKKYGCVYI